MALPVTVTVHTSLFVYLAVNALLVSTKAIVHVLFMMLAVVIVRPPTELLAMNFFDDASKMPGNIPNLRLSLGFGFPLSTSLHFVFRPSILNLCCRMATVHD